MPSARRDSRSQRTGAQPMFGTLRPGASSARHRARQQAEALGAAELLGALEEQLQAEADAEDRRPRRGPLGDQLVEPGRADPLHRPREGADAGQDQAVGGAHSSGSAQIVAARADVLERLLDRAQVPHPVVQDQIRRAAAPRRGRLDAHSLSVPLVEGTPVSSGSIETATRSARAKALKEASIMWWALVP